MSHMCNMGTIDFANKHMNSFISLSIIIQQIHIKNYIISEM
jgi:hypothetical protein